MDDSQQVSPAIQFRLFLNHASNGVPPRDLKEANSSTMKSTLSAESINYADFRHQLRFYKDLVPESLQGLEELRLREVPEILAQRRLIGNAALDKTEVTALVEWKL